ncbi:3-isopropylmalate dehydratase large subunit [Candidatus Bathyarchaeota archaeon]|nr:MAG: 3-isopropylmalate dehydratase large subunit [Candidatus Bathyarchaeota archaeon]
MSNLPLTKKILAKACGKSKVESGEFIEAKVDVVMINDLTGPLTIDAFEKFKVKKIWDRSRIVVILDHQVPADRVQSAELHKKLRKFVFEYGIVNFYDVGRGGICHQVLAEGGHVKPGDLVVGADSHTCTLGALGAFATGIGSTDAAAVFATGRLWFKVPEVVKVEVSGKFKSYVFPKDLILHIIGFLGEDGANYKALEFTGETIQNMSIEGRMTICNMVVESGAKTGIIEPDSETIRYLMERIKDSITPIRGDLNAEYEETLSFNVENLEPQVSCPPNVSNVKVVDELENIKVDQAFLGSCTNGRLEDLEVAARILRNRKVNKDTRMIVIPASQEIYIEALKRGLLEIFVKAGAFVGPPTCGPCLGGHFGLLGDDEVCISSSNRNFTGRMGSSKAKVYLASPATVAASAVTGRITNPKNFLKS